MKTRRHHNNKGERQIRRGKTRKQVEQIARRFWKWKKRQDRTATKEAHEKEDTEE